MDLEDRIKYKYDSVSLHVKIKKEKRNLGEIDIIAKKGGKVDLYEVKCSHRILKAKKQRKKIQKVLNLEKSKSYFYCGSSGRLVAV